MGTVHYKDIEENEKFVNAQEFDSMLKKFKLAATCKDKRIHWLRSGRSNFKNELWLNDNPSMRKTTQIISEI